MTDVLINLSITGGFIILIWYLSYPVTKRYFKASWHYAMLKISLVFLVFPISLFSPLFAKMPELPVINMASTISEVILPEIQSVTYVPEKTALNIPYPQIIWIIGTVIMLSYSFYKMYKLRKQLIQNSTAVDSEIFTQCKDELRIRYNVNLRKSTHLHTPLAFGLMHPTVILSDTEMTPEEQWLVILHELTHIKNGDLWVKFIACVVSAVHWFNPLVYLLQRKLCVISEEYCDDNVIKNMEPDARMVYCNLILKSIADKSMPKYCSNLSASAKNIKRRLSNMINNKKTNKIVLMVSIVIALLICSIATIFAIDTPKNVIVPIIEEKQEEAKSKFFDFMTANQFNGTIDELITQIEVRIENLENLIKTIEDKFAGEFVDAKNEINDKVKAVKDLRAYLNEVKISGNYDGVTDELVNKYGFKAAAITAEPHSAIVIDPSGFIRVIDLILIP